MIDLQARDTPDAAAADEEAQVGEEARVAEAGRAVECVLFVSGEPVTIERLVTAVGQPPEVITQAVSRLVKEYEARGLQVQAVAGGYQLGTHPAYAEAVERYLGEAGREPLSQAGLEVLAIVAYRQPVTRPEIEAVRGVRSDHLLQRLEERQLIRVVGRKVALGRPFLYGTTDAFLRHFGLHDLSQLPPMEQFGLRASEAGAGA